MFGFPKSVKKVLLALSRCHTQHEIRKETGLSVRTIKSSLYLLKQLGYVQECIVFSDMRRKNYLLVGGELK
jgi:predicted transcriptional regulator